MLHIPLNDATCLVVFPDLKDDSGVFSGPVSKARLGDQIFKTLKLWCSFILKLSKSLCPLGKKTNRPKIWSFRDLKNFSFLSGDFLDCLIMNVDFWPYFPFYKPNLAALIMLTIRHTHTHTHRGVERRSGVSWTCSTLKLLIGSCCVDALLCILILIWPFFL